MIMLHLCSQSTAMPQKSFIQILLGYNAEKYGKENNDVFSIGDKISQEFLKEEIRQDEMI